MRAIRKFRGLTQIGVAEKAGLRQGYIPDMEAGKMTVKRMAGMRA